MGGETAVTEAIAQRQYCRWPPGGKERKRREGRRERREEGRDKEEETRKQGRKKEEKNHLPRLVLCGTTF